MVFRNAPEVKDFVEQFIGEDFQCKMGGITAASRISPNVNVGGDCYANDILADSAEVLAEGLKAGTARFDASDLMPGAVGTGSFWKEMTKWISGQENLDAALKNIDDSWPSS